MKGTIIAFLFTISLVGQAQILRIDHKTNGQDSLTGWLGDMEVDLLLNNLKSTQSKQVTYVGFKLLTNLSYFSAKHQFYSKNELMYFKGEEETFLNRGFSYFRVNWNRQKLIHPETVLQVQFDNVRHLDFRMLGVQYVKLALKTEEFYEFDFGLGPMVERERWVDFENADKLIIKNLIKLSSYMGVYASLNEKASLSLYNIYQVGFDHEDGLWRNRVSTSFQLTDHLSKKIDIVISFTGAYDARPIVPVSEFIYELTNGIRIRF